MHSGKAQLHSGKPSPSATLGEEPPANPPTRKAPSPSVENRALGECFAECRAGTRGRLDAVGRRPKPFFFYFLPRVQHSGKIFEFFLNTLCRVPQLRHSAKKFVFFKKNPSFPSATAQALGEATSKILFFCFLLFHVNNKAYIYISQTTNQHQYVTNHIYISQTTKFVRNPQYITNYTFKSTHYSKFTSSIHKNDSAVPISKSKL